MEEITYIHDDEIDLVTYTEADYHDRYQCWLDPATQKGYNFILRDTHEEYCHKQVENRSRFIAVIKRHADGARMGCLFLSPEGSPPDLAIMLYAPYRGMGYGTAAFKLGLRYCFDNWHLDCIYAGCYEGNVASRHMLDKCGFTPHPEGNVSEKHYITGETIIQYDFVKYPS